MKKSIALLLAATMCFAFAGCNSSKEEKEKTPSVTVTENTDPKTLASEKVDRAAWTGAFSDTDNFGVKSVITVTETENGDTMSEVITFVYRFDGGKVSMDMTLQEDGKTSYIAAGYLEISKDEVTVWQRAKENEGWTEWDSETYAKADLPEVFTLAEGLKFVKDEYANFSYNETEKGYAATASGIAAMQDALDGFLASVLSQAGGDAEEFDVSKFVVKVNDGKVGACLAELKSKTPAPEAHDAASDEDGQAPSDGTPEARPDVSISLAQVYFDYGKVSVKKPADIPASPAPEEDAIEIVPR